MTSMPLILKGLRGGSALIMSFYFPYSDVLTSGALLILEGLPLQGEAVPGDSKQLTPLNVPSR